MKKMIFKACLMVGIVIGISNYMMYIMTGQTPLSQLNTPDLSISSGLNEIKEKVSPTKVYKWVDENGVTQYSSEPPPNLDLKAQTLEIHDDVNVIQGLVAEGEEESVEEENPQVALPQGPMSVYSPEAVQKLVNDAQDVQKILSERYENLEKLSGNADKDDR